MTLNLNIQQMLKAYPDHMPEVDKLREVLQQTALLGLARHHFFEHAATHQKQYNKTHDRLLKGKRFSLARLLQSRTFFTSSRKPLSKFSSICPFFVDILGKRKRLV